MSDKYKNFSVDPYRLPGNVIPMRYTLKLSPDLDTNIFSGKVTIKLSVKTRTNTLTL